MMPFPFLFILMLCGFGLTFMSSYLAREHFFPYWDYQNYYDITRFTYNHFIQGHYSLVLSTLDSDRNTFFTLPHFLTFALFGDSKPVFMYGNVLFYVIPFALGVGLLCRKLYADSADKGQTAFYVGATLAMLQPSAWTSTALGFPDMGGALLVLCALLVFWRDELFTSWRTPVALGALLAVTAVFRRHYAYAACLLLLVFGLFSLRQAVFQGIKGLLTQIARSCLLAVGFVLAFVLFAPSFFWRSVTSGEGSINDGWRSGWQAVANNLLTNTGYLCLLLAVLGFCALLARPGLRRRVGLMLLVLSALWFAVWVFLVQVASYQYMTQFIPLVLSVTATAAVMLLVGVQGRTGSATAAVLVLLVAANFWGTFYPRPSQQSALYQRRFFTAKSMPMVRADYDDVFSLVKFLRDKRIAPEQNVVLVAASNSVLSDHIVFLAEEFLSESVPEPKKLRVLDSPQVDSRDPIPTKAMAEADFLVVAEPEQLHLGREHQRRVLAMLAAFRESWPYADHFERLESKVWLGDDHSLPVVVYRKKTPLSDDDIKDLDARLKEFLARPKGAPGT